ncbi:MAG: carboxypeptidase regulatory-like domain-containing protein, partial [Gammaproteobacteria bacterium]|nr:carboxypeptidase regulatory-like domain-containing protein [Gammaproteobacteria bacterium]
MKPLYYSCIKNGVIVVLALFAIQATQAFVLEIKTGKLVYALAEPVVLYVSVKNMDDELAQLPAHLGPDFQEVNYAISEVSGGDKLFVPWIRKDSWEPVRNFASGEVREEEVKLFFSAQGWAYPTPGTYTITAEFAGQSSNPLTITVGNAAPATLRTADGDDAEAAAQLLLHSGQAGFFLLFEGGPHLTKGIEILEQIVADYPNTPHAAYARTALGNHQREQGNYQEALALLNAAKAQPAGFYNTVHTHAFLYRTHMAAENAAEAQAVLDSLEETVSEQFSELASFTDAVFRDNGVPLEDTIHCISGQILDNTGNPLADAAVRVSGYPQTAVADESGQYQIDGLRPG